MELRLWPTDRTLHIDIFVTRHRVSDRYLDQLVKNSIPPKEGDTLNIPKLGSLASAAIGRDYDKTTPPDDPYEGVDHIIKIVVDVDPDGDPAAVIGEHNRRTGETSISGGKLENLDE